MAAVRPALPTRKKAGAVLVAAVAISSVAFYLLGVNPLAIFVSLVAGNLVLAGTIAIGAGIAGTIATAAATTRDIAGKTAAKVFAAGASAGAVLTAAGAGGVAAATSTGPILPSIGTFLPSGSIAAAAVSVIVALAIGNPFLLALVGASVVFFITDPLSKRGGFLESASFAIKISAVALLAFLAVTEVGPALSSTLGTPVFVAGWRE